MSHSAVRRLSIQVFNFVNVRSSVCSSRPLISNKRHFCDKLKDKKNFDPYLLQFLVCPLSKKPLRYDESTNELINEELGIAYPIIDGIPNMIPQDARLIKKTEGSEEPTQS